MKTLSFYDLNETQQKEAIQFAKKQLSKALDAGILELELGTEHADTESLVIAAAEGAIYAEDGTPVPPKFLGGCV